MKVFCGLKKFLKLTFRIAENKNTEELKNYLPTDFISDMK